jgi:hypothetical protein
MCPAENMKKLILTIFTLYAAILGHSQASEPKPMKVTLERLYYAATLGQNTEYVFIMGNAAYRSVDELKKGVLAYPKGSQITWSPGCMVSGGEPLQTEKERSDFESFCKKQNVTLVIVPSG